MKRLLFYSVVLSGFLTSCAPKVVTSIIKEYPPLPENEEVIVYERAKDDKVPKSAETIGKVAVVDNGASMGVSYEKAVKLASDETRKFGGNALLVTDHEKPSFWGSSIHQIGGTMLRVDKNNLGEMVSSKETYVSIEEDNRRNYIPIPNHIFNLNVGYGNIYNRSKDISSEAKKFESILSQGLSWDAKYSYHHKGSMYGVGVIFSQFYSNYLKDVYFNSLYHSVRVDYIGLMMSLKYHFSPEWLYHVEFGLGYLGARQKLTDKFNKGYITASNLGANFGIGISYKISKHFAIGVDLSMVGGTFSSVNYENLTPDPDAPKIDDKNRWGVSRINIETGIQYHF